MKVSVPGLLLSCLYRFDIFDKMCLLSVVTDTKFAPNSHFIRRL